MNFSSSLHIGLLTGYADLLYGICHVVCLQLRITAAHCGLAVLEKKIPNVEKFFLIYKDDLPDV